MKKEIRTKMLSLRNSLTESEVKKSSIAIVERIKKDINFINAKTVAIYYPINNEINLLDLYIESKTFLLPKIYKDTLLFYEWKKKDKLKRSKFGILEPISNTPYLGTIDYMLVPALAISKEKDRIGYGKGYYDQYLGTNKVKQKIGVIYNFQEIEYIKTNKNDIKLDFYMKG